MRVGLVLWILGVLVLPCAAQPTTLVPAVNAPSVIAPGLNTPSASRTTHESLNGTLWVQTSLEYRMVCAQAYTLATCRLDAALCDPQWTALVEPVEARTGLKPAVILDVDETVLDNSPFQARLIQHDMDYSGEVWADWVNQMRAEPVPGVIDFVKHARDQEVALFFVTNRDAALEETTAENLTQALGFPVTRDMVFCKNERPEWTSDKSTRRTHLAATHRILLLLGDDFNDFVSLGDVSPAKRVELGKQYAQRWGKQWILLPNPLYGHWEKSIYGYDYSTPDGKKLQQKHDLLDGKE